MASRPVVIAGNWKMYKTAEETKEFLKKLTPVLEDATCKVLLAVPFTAIQTAVENAHGVEIGAQNMHDEKEGAFTGEISARMLKEAGASFVLLGHSERRRLFGEDNAWINRKALRAIEAGLTPIVCCGETLEERKNGLAEKIVRDQLVESLQGIQGNVMIAYEPVWAIGTGVVATPEQAQTMHHLCRNGLAREWGREVSEKIPLLYGGSVKPDNIKGLLEQPDIDGVLVGGASLSADSFAQLINYQTIKV